MRFPSLDRAATTINRLRYYAAGITRHALPRSWFLQKSRAILRDLEDAPELADLVGRANYYNRLSRDAAKPGVRLDAVDRGQSRYYLDLDEYLRYFDRHLKIDYLFGDVTWVPSSPCLVKSRPTDQPNANSVLLNLDKLRHFRFPRDETPWESKKPLAVWRGAPNNPLRIELIKRHRNSVVADVGQVNETIEGLAPKGFLSPRQQMGYRYIISIEGFDVATNLKWIMASGSVCLMPKGRFETWFREGALIPDHHFVELRPDFSDLEDQIASLEKNPQWAQDIVANANAYVASFSDRETERKVSLLVLQKYFEATGQLPPSPLSPLFFPDATDARA
ncbi:lipopolysaccharide biosynthesis protein [Rhizobium sp. AQ_MP]|uniref:glycosyl transferase family 90 n=1 Tax=Rhizobium sp. AQ_MP TaxID=2761536 RepID=UPI00163B5AD0|nr:glycosyl transferase family 90 [Rhizobium sp. AQ_MP]MBC2772515.1 lipopolysaccharide biosynthesis protein [Rhizobium sp. AQ_MP]